MVDINSGVPDMLTSDNMLCQFCLIWTLVLSKQFWADMRNMGSRKTKRRTTIRQQKRPIPDDCLAKVSRFRHDDAQSDVTTTLRKPENTNIMQNAELVLTMVMQTIAWRAYPDDCTSGDGRWSSVTLSQSMRRWLTIAQMDQ